MPLDARSVANFLLDCAASENIDMTSMSLLKVLYFAHAWHLAKYRKPLVAQPFEAWQNGPVNRIVYEQVKKFGKNPITQRLTVLDPKTVKFIPAVVQLDQETEKFLRNIFSYYGKFHAFKLSDITHTRGTPWEVIWSKAESKAVPGMWIPDNLILEWFEETGGRSYFDSIRGVNS
jgi:uncharacterized phage-associated protein